MTESDWRAELGAKATDILGRFGVAGKVEVENRRARLTRHGPTVEVTLTDSDAASAARGPSELKALAERLARDLSRARRSATSPIGAQPDWFGWLRRIAPLLIVTTSVWLAFRYSLPNGSGSSKDSSTAMPPSGALQNPPPQLPDKRASDDENCQRTISRVQRGGTVTPLDVDGWVVELSLVGAPGSILPTATALNHHFRTRPGEGDWTHDSVHTPLLNQADAAQSGVVIKGEPLSTIGGKTGSGVVITWRGRYVAPYFQQSDRSEYVKLAGVLFDDLRASHGALYARCALGTGRYLGSWFRGPDVGGALWMLVAQMEVASGSARLKLSDGAKQPDEIRAALEHLAGATHSIKRKRAAYLLASSGGMVSESLGHHATVEFPFSPANRANLASSSIASKVWP